ncbi:zinc-binding dehydrogenase [Candidatus Palauibacter soopunensis]|uniref:zinc-binding dehydrogenase n=1 Tax=Candidatus Palauibacter soopunensis TaxID=3056739 RepID=UPI0023A0DEC9|nr:zinc-binding dehydrogenase [Candidatus Palauibacter soopunensis]MDE2879184.1 zinc-binding dehydrogenase [Candidatus Palauibacter soopunensis]
MKAVLYDAHGDADQLHVGEVPDPEPASGEALVRIRACGLNGFDPMMLGGTTGLRVPLPMTPCGDAAGEIAGFGPGTDAAGRQVGDRVMIDPLLESRGMLGEKAPGAASEYLAVPLENLLPIPDGVAFEQAAALPVAYGTALRMIEHRARVQPGETVLILGATGGVGCCCVQLCKRIGARVIATGGSRWKLERLQALGADHVLPSGSAELVRQVRAIAGRPRYHDPDAGGVDVVINYIGGPTWADSLKALRFQGRMVTCGATAGYDPRTDIRYIWSFEQSIIGSDGWSREGLARLLDMVAGGDLDPVIHAVRPVDEIRTAMCELMERAVFGKSILTP